MSLHIEIAFSVPEQTVRVARAAFPKGNRYLILRDQLGTLFEDQQFTDLYPPQGQPAEAPWRLALVTVLQFAEGMSNRQAADAVRSRIDWKYVMGLELTDPGFDYFVLCEFRARLLQNGAEQRLFDTLLTLCRECGLVKAGGKLRTDSTHVLTSVRPQPVSVGLGNSARGSGRAGCRGSAVVAQASATGVERALRLSRRTQRHTDQASKATSLLGHRWSRRCVPAQCGRIVGASCELA